MIWPRFRDDSMEIPDEQTGKGCPSGELLTSETHPLDTVMMASAEEVFLSQDLINIQAEALGYTELVVEETGSKCGSICTRSGVLDYNEAHREMQRLRKTVEKSCRLSIARAPLDAAAGGVTLDSVFVRDMVVFTPKGTVGCRLACSAIDRTNNGDRIQQYLHKNMSVDIIGQITAPGALCGSDVVWAIPERLAIVRESKDSNTDGILQLRQMLPRGVELLSLTGSPSAYLTRRKRRVYLRSYLALVRENLIASCAEFLPDEFVGAMTKRGFSFVWLPLEETLNEGACEMLSLGNNSVVVPSGCKKTVQLLTERGVKVISHDGSPALGVHGGGWLGSMALPIHRVCSATTLPTRTDAAASPVERGRTAA